MFRSMGGIISSSCNVDSIYCSGGGRQRICSTDVQVRKELYESRLGKNVALLRMAVNVNLVRGPTPRNRNGNVLIPQPYDQELFILRRDDMELELKDETGTLVPALKGSMHMTNVRMAFVIAEKYLNRTRYRSVEIPFRGIENEALNQPLLGANNLSGTVIPYDGEPFIGTVRFKLYFKNGGVGTFLPRFNHVLGSSRIYNREMRRRQREEEQRRQDEMFRREERQWNQGSMEAPPPAPGGPPPVWYGVNYSADQFHAIYDPSDPSEVYLVQPETQRRNAPPDYNLLD